MTNDVAQIAKAADALDRIASFPQPVAPIPGPIVKAVCRIMASIDAVKKSQRNGHGGYNYASTDDIYAELTRKMGEVGLLVLSLEDATPEIINRDTKDGKTSQWAKFSFSFVLATEDATWSDPRSRRTLFIQITGAQSFQAAQSYAEKSYLRSLFKIATGDMDLDGLPQGDTEEDQVALAGNGNGKAKRKSSSAAKKDGTTEQFNELRGKIAKCDDADLLVSFRAAVSDTWEAMPSRWVEILDHEYADRLSDLQEARGF
jgi:hypothetical protein